MRNVEVKVWMIRNRLTQVGLAAELGVPQPTVHQVVWGFSRNKRVIDALIRKGCPPEFFDDAPASGRAP